MAVDTVTVHKKSNPSITRVIQRSALKTFTRRGWVESGTGKTAEQSLPQKKTELPVGDVAAPGENLNDAGEIGPFAKVLDGGDVETSNEPGSEETADEKNPLDALREEFQIISGEKADKRWNEKRLKMEIDKAKEANQAGK